MIASWMLVMVMLVLLLVLGGLVLFALQNKGDVRAKFAWGRSLFELEAKDRRSR